MRQILTAALAAAFLLVSSAAAETITPSGNAPPAVAYASLPTCNSTTSKGMRRRVTDSNTTTAGAIVAGGGANLVVVECNGTNWIVDVPGTAGGGGSGVVETIVNSDGYLSVDATDPANPDITLGSDVVVKDLDNTFGIATTQSFILSSFVPPQSSACAPTNTQWCIDTNGVSALANPMHVFDTSSVDYYSIGFTLAQLGSAGTARIMSIGTDNEPGTILYSATPTANAIPLADGSNKIADGWLSSAVSLLGQTIGIGEIVTGDKTGTGAKLATSTGTLTSGRCTEIDANGNFVQSAGPCGASYSALSQIDTAVSDWIASLDRLNSESEVRSSGLKVMPLPDSALATGESVRKGATAFEAYTPVTEAIALNGRLNPDAFPLNAIFAYHAGNPNGSIACDAGSGVLDENDSSELGRKFVWNTSTTPDELWVCTGTGDASTATWDIFYAPPSGDHPKPRRLDTWSIANIGVDTNTNFAFQLMNEGSGNQNWDSGGQGALRASALLVNQNKPLVMRELTVSLFSFGAGAGWGDDEAVELILWSCATLDSTPAAADCTEQDRYLIENNASPLLSYGGSGGTNRPAASCVSGWCVLTFEMDGLGKSGSNGTTSFAAGAVDYLILGYNTANANFTADGGTALTNWVVGLTIDYEN